MSLLSAYESGIIYGIGVAIAIELVTTYVTIVTNNELINHVLVLNLVRNFYYLS